MWKLRVTNLHRFNRPTHFGQNGKPPRIHRLTQFKVLQFHSISGVPTFLLEGYATASCLVSRTGIPGCFVGENQHQNQY